MSIAIYIFIDGTLRPPKQTPSARCHLYNVDASDFGGDNVLLCFN